MVNIKKLEKKLHKKAFPKAPKHYPRPKYAKCNQGHALVEVYNERRNSYVWDCPICIERMRIARMGGY